VRGLFGDRASLELERRWLVERSAGAAGVLRLLPRDLRPRRRRLRGRSGSGRGLSRVRDPAERRRAKPPVGVPLRVPARRRPEALTPRAAADDPEPDERRPLADREPERDAAARLAQEEAARIGVPAARVVAAAREAERVEDAAAVAPHDRDAVSPRPRDAHDDRLSLAAADDHPPLAEPLPRRRSGLGRLREVLARSRDGVERNATVWITSAHGTVRSPADPARTRPMASSASICHEYTTDECSVPDRS